MGLPALFIINMMNDDLMEQQRAAPRPLPTYAAGNPLGYNQARPFQDYDYIPSFEIRPLGKNSCLGANYLF